MADRNELLGYAVPMVARAGDTVQIMVSTEADRYDAEIVRLIHGDTNPQGPGLKTERVDLEVNGSYPGRHQEIHIGSFVEVPSSVALDGGTGISIQAWIWPTTPDLDTPQGIVVRHDGRRGYGLFIEGGSVALHIGTERLATATGLVAQRWYFVAATYDAVSGNATVEWRLVEPRAERQEASSGILTGQADATGMSLLLAAGRLRPSRHPAAVECYNGKTERPRVYSRAISAAELDSLAAGTDPLQVDDLASAWDFSATDAPSSVIADVGPGGHHGKAVNYPMRGLSGHIWDGSVFTRHESPLSYGAIHFHADDSADARWEADFEFVVPSDLRSGYYAAHLQGAGEHDYVPFFVSPLEGAPTEEIGYLVRPTLTSPTRTSVC